MSSPAAPTSKKAVFFSRLFSTLLMWGLVTWVFVSQKPIMFVGLVGVLAALAFYEILQMSRLSLTGVIRGMSIFVAVIFAVLLAQGILSGKSESGLLEVSALAVLLFLSFAVAMRRAPEGNQTMVEVCLPILAFVMVPIMFFGALMRLLFAVPGEGAVPGAWLVVFCVMVTKFSDMGAYITGSLFGKKKMIPHISPGKTWAGLVGGIIIPVATACALYALQADQLAMIPSWIDVIVLGALLGAVAVVGDLAASVIKRCLGAKDSGAFLPGIGGIFDLIDSICFTAPILWLYLALRGAMIAA